MRSEPPRLREAHRIEPKLGDFAVSFNMNMGRFCTLETVKEKPVGIDPQDGRHLSVFCALRIIT
jgi:hypothetical protein